MRRIDPMTLVLTLVTLVAFASNSLLTRLALGQGNVDAATFTTLRLGAGALVLTAIARARSGTWAIGEGRGALAPLSLIAYAIPFSFAYVRIGAATGALVLFGVVQLTMVGWGMLSGQRPTLAESAGLGLATIGLAALTRPSATRPDPLGLLLMAAAGLAWGVYSLAGRASGDPVGANARSFLWSLPLAIVMMALGGPVIATPRGVMLAVVCGGVTSALGYVAWYHALPRLSVTQAAAAQLSVPALAALGGVLFLGERLTLRLVVCGLAILGGIGLALAAHARPVRRHDSRASEAGCA